jgi:hypothetical protein
MDGEVALLPVVDGNAELSREFFDPGGVIGLQGGHSCLQNVSTCRVIVSLKLNWRGGYGWWHGFRPTKEKRPT